MANKETPPDSEEEKNKKFQVRILLGGSLISVILGANSLAILFLTAAGLLAVI